MSESLYVFTLLLIAATCVLIFSVRAWAAFQGAKARQAREDAYRDLAAKCVATQAEGVSQMAALQAELVRVCGRLTAIEGVLRSVE